MKKTILALALSVTLTLCGCGGGDNSEKPVIGGVSSDTASESSTSPTPENSSSQDIESSNVDSSEYDSSEDDANENPYTVKALLSYATQPVGRCLYVWSGGWNEEDTAAGIDAMTYGVSDRWYEFFTENGSDYDTAETAFQIHDGLDCTGYLGWSVYQVFGDLYSDSGYVFQSGTVADNFLRLFGGTLTPSNEVDSYRAGDIMCRNGHVFIIIGECNDGSVVFMHASPPAVSICGTVTPSGSSDSEAIALAEKYMEEYRNECFLKYDTCERGTSYLTDYDRYRFDEAILSDPDGYGNMTPEEVLKNLFP